MIDFPVPLAMTSTFAHRVIPDKTPAVAPVQDSSASGQSALQHNNGRGHQPPKESPRQAMQFHHNDRLVGPPPSFQANVLEVEVDIKHAIERFEKSRQEFRSRDATETTRPADQDKIADDPAMKSGPTPPGHKHDTHAEIDRLA